MNPKHVLRPLGRLVLVAAFLVGCAGRQAVPSPTLDHAVGSGDQPLIDDGDRPSEPPPRVKGRLPPDDRLPSGPDQVTDQPSERADRPDDGAAGQGPAEARSQEPAPGPGIAMRPGQKVPFAGPKGTIHRGELIQLLDKQPAAFLRNVDSEPGFEGGRFRGWRILSFYPGDSRFAGIDLFKGDVVLRINSRPIEQPEQFIQVWQELRGARELRVELLRNGRPHIARWTIVD